MDRTVRALPIRAAEASVWAPFPRFLPMMQRGGPGLIWARRPAQKSRFSATAAHSVAPAHTLAQTHRWPAASFLARPPRRIYSTAKPPPSSNGASEKEVAEKKIEPRPDEVSTQSSVRHFIENSQAPHEAPPVSNAIMKDVNSIKEALALTAVPRASYALGLTGTLPYFATSMATVYLGWVLRSAPSTSPLRNTFSISHETAQHWLTMLEPIQLGYGAVLISFLGAVHLGMEYMEKAPSHERTRFRYGMGIVAPLVAWPTLLLPIQFALTGQFAAYTLMYYADNMATRRGWAPPWYGTYRFVLTFIVGTAILISLVFRARADVGGTGASGVAGRMEDGMHRRGKLEEEYDAKWAKRETEDKERAQKENEKTNKDKSSKDMTYGGQGGKGDDRSSEGAKSVNIKDGGANGGTTAADGDSDGDGKQTIGDDDNGGDGAENDGNAADKKPDKKA